MLFYKALVLLPFAVAFPAPNLGISSFSNAKGCSIDSVKVKLPSELVIPPGEKPSLLTIGRGVQNYTCTAGAWASAGAVANLYDVSCLARFFDVSFVGAVLPHVAYKGLSFPDDKSRLPVAIDHYFVSSGTGIAPVFASKTDHVLAKRVNGVPAPTNPSTNVPWLSLGAVEGTLAKSVFRINTVNGQPPASCTTEGESLSVQYATVYLFTK